MFKKILLGFIVMSIVACSQSGNQELVTPSGYSYSHAKMGSEKTKPGDFVSFTLTIKGSDGTILQEMGEGPSMPVMQLPTAEKPLTQPNPVLEAIGTASIGDTLTLIMPLDSIPGAATNPQLAGMTHIEYVAVVKASKDEATQLADNEAKRLEMEAAAEESKKRLPEIESLIATSLKDYKSGKLKTQSLDSGLKYHIIEQGTGEQAENGKRASVNYYGVTMDGKMFDNSFRRGAPYPFTLGRGEVIKGWDLGIPLLKVGGKGVLFIPYQLAYGEAGSPPNIGPKAELVFYVELAELN